mgnify:CR=1 FL=1
MDYGLYYHYSGYTFPHIAERKKRDTFAWYDTNNKTVMEEIMQLDNVFQYNELLHCETLHPLVNVIDFSTCTPAEHIRFCLGFYAIFLKDVKCGDIQYGRSTYDYQEGTLVFIAPGQCVGITRRGEMFQPKGWALLFHPDLIKGTSLGQGIKQYSFFSYSSTEALHLSEDEKEIFLDCLKKIKMEIQRPIDKHSKGLIARNIELLLDYCMRFYERQFITRSAANKDILMKFEALIDDYFQSDKPQTEGLPSVKYFADKVFLSSNYFGDLVKKETGKTAQEYIQNKIIDLAKEMIIGSGKTVSQIAYELGYQYSQHFNRVFKKNVGYTPSEYRHLQV